MCRRKTAPSASSIHGRPVSALRPAKATLIPSGRPRLGSIKFDWWHSHAPPLAR